MTIVLLRFNGEEERMFRPNHLAAINGQLGDLRARGGDNSLLRFYKCNNVSKFHFFPYINLCNYYL